MPHVSSWMGPLPDFFWSGGVALMAVHVLAALFCWSNRMIGVSAVASCTALFCLYSPSARAVMTAASFLRP